VAEGLSATEVGKEIGKHARRHKGDQGDSTPHERLISISEAILLSVVTIVAAWSGFSAAKWGSESSLQLAKASATRTAANRYFDGALTYRATDATMFNAWFTAYLAGNKNGMRVARKRFRPQYVVAFDAWLATHPFTNPKAPPGPQSMPEYKPTGQALSVKLDKQAIAFYDEGEHATNTSDDYVRVTVILASVLFLIGISTQFSLRNVRYSLILVGAALLIFATEQILSLPGPP